MKQCGRCGAQNRDDGTTCTACGLALRAAGTGLGGTLLMAPTEKAPLPGAPNLNLRGTMIGIAPPEVLTRPAAEAPPATAPGSPPGQAPGRHFAATMIGIAAPPPPPPGPAGAGEASQPDAHAAAPHRISSAQKTVLGVARPGIAPLNPGQPKPVPAEAPPAPAAVAPGVVWAPAPPITGRPAGYPPAVGRAAPRWSLSAALAIAGSAALAGIAALAFFMLRGHGSVTARASLDARGNEQLELTCVECPDGTTTWVDAAPAAFTAGKATLGLSRPLKVGDNPVVLVLERPGRRREEIALSLPIEFRVRGSVEQLAQESPKVSVLAGVQAGTKLEVDGKLVPTDPSGAVRFDYEVATQLTGPEASVKTLERVVPYRATSASGRSQEGRVEIRIGITPLVVDAPGDSIIVGTKELVLAGRTAPGSELRIGAQVIATDAEGRFVSKQSLAVGENSFMVRATLKDHAPRLVKVSVRRSDDLEREAALASTLVQTSYAEVLRAKDSAIGRSLALEGELFDLRHDGYSSVLLIDVKDGCRKAPCLSKVLYGTETPLDRGRRLRAFGKLVRFVDGPRQGERIPEVRANLVVPGAR